MNKAVSHYFFAILALGGESALWLVLAAGKASINLFSLIKN